MGSFDAGPDSASANPCMNRAKPSEPSWRTAFGYPTVTDPPPAPETMFRSGNVRRSLLAGGLATIIGRDLRSEPASTLRFGTTPVFLDEQIGLLGRWQHLLQQQLRRPVRFVQRGTYREIVDLLLDESLDAAWLCGFPSVVYESQLVVIAVPLYRGAPLYRSYLIVPESDISTTHVADLRGRVFAYSDPRSNSGYLVPQVELLRRQLRPDTFFRRTFFTFGHRKVVEAVQVGLAHGGAVDSYVWDTLRAQQPHSTEGVRVAWRSPPFGFPPVVARRTLPPEQRAELVRALSEMPGVPEGRRVLESLNLDSFVEPPRDLLDGIRALVREHAITSPPRS